MVLTIRGKMNVGKGSGREKGKQESPPLHTTLLKSGSQMPNRTGRSAGRVAAGRVTKSHSFPGTVRVSAPKVLHPKDPLSPG